MKNKELSDQNIVRYYKAEVPEEEIIFSLPEYKTKEQTSDSNTLYRGIERESDRWMEMACDMASESVKTGGGPFGAVILQIDKDSGKIIRYWRNHNQVTAINDPTAHAEVMTIRNCCKDLGVFDLGNIHRDQSKLSQPSEYSYCVIYSSCEPCPMCYSSICWARIPIILFGANRFDAAADGVGFSDEAIYKELETPYNKRETKCYHCTSDKALEPFELWKSVDKIHY